MGPPLQTNEHVGTALRQCEDSVLVSVATTLGAKTAVHTKQQLWGVVHQQNGVRGL